MAKRYRILAFLAAAVLTVPAMARADCTLAANMADGNLTIEWQADKSIRCGTITLYRDNWPILVLCAQGTGGSYSVPRGYTSMQGSYKVALRGGGYCVAAQVPGPGTAATFQPAATSAPTACPTAASVETAAPTVTPTATAKPTAAPTAALTAVPIAQTGSQSSSLAQELIAEVNRDRAASGLGTLSEDAQLTAAACVRAREITEKFSHTRPDGSSWSTVYSGAYAENIAKGYDTAVKCEAAFMSSEGHRANILREGYTKIGVCAYTVNGVTYWVQLFGK